MSSRIARTWQNSIVPPGLPASASSSSSAAALSPISRWAIASATPSSARMTVMLVANAAWRTPAAMRRASTGRPASASPRARVPSKLRRRSASRLSASSASRTSSHAGGPPLGQRHVPGHHVPPEPPERIAPPRPAHLRHRLARQQAALDPATRHGRRHRAEHRHPGQDRRLRARTVRPPGEPVHELDEPVPIDQEVAPGELEHRRQVRGRHLGRDGGDGPPHGHLAATVVQLAGLDRQQTEGIARAAREEPVIEGGGRLVVLLVPPRRPHVPFGQPPWRLCLRLRDQRGPHQRVDLVPARRGQAGHEQPALLGMAEHVAGVLPARQRPGQARVHPVDDGEVGHRLDDCRDPRPPAPRARCSPARARCRRRRWRPARRSPPRSGPRGRRAAGWRPTRRPARRPRRPAPPPATAPTGSAGHPPPRWRTSARGTGSPAVAPAPATGRAGAPGRGATPRRHGATAAGDRGTSPATPRPPGPHRPGADRRGRARRPDTSSRRGRPRGGRRPG